MLWTITVLKNYFSSHHQLTSLRKEVPLNLNTLTLWHHGTFSWLEFIDNRKESDLQNIDLNKTQKLLKVVHRVKKLKWCQRLSASKQFCQQAQRKRQ